ncbi:MAG: hypothetical protein AAGB07_15625 [Pseudomonadota bacterium]
MAFDTRPWHAISHQGWRYEYEEDRLEYGYDRWHKAVNETSGRVISLHHTSNEILSAEAFKAHVDLQFPPREQCKTRSYPWRNASVIEAAERAAWNKRQDKIDADFAQALKGAAA